ncbi:dTMP kinase [Larsenimonas rhizosphaerae]|uniref:Thymidylate kinase n=1 Tax=Larsenimonas rhizosphaerae TaxID=2944682 RepID=A0AA41ZF43_9GAMM|nr:dTMP kinase [Larsenimonas rhizosphaerae]MCX2523662.1 dTMP kinase [Larsenimonas rhizosphaerae]
MSAAHGGFITLEGSEGVGKTTNMTFVCDYLAAQGLEVVRTREPGGAPRAESIRALLLDPSNDEPLDDCAELLLVFAARAQHLSQVVRPAMARGAIVVCDRFTDATYAYQGAARGMPSAWIDQLRGLVHPALTPDITFLLDMPVADAANRVAARGGQTDRFEQERAAFFEQVRQGYLSLAAQEPGRVKVIDAARSLKAIEQDIMTHLDRLIPSWT